MESGAKGCEVNHKETLNLVSSFEQLGGRERKAEGPEGQVHEVCGRSHDPLWRPRQRLRRLCLQTRSPEAGCAWNQGIAEIYNQNIFSKAPTSTIWLVGRQ